MSTPACALPPPAPAPQLGRRRMTRRLHNFHLLYLFTDAGSLFRTA
jgi:hypothetical protein